MNAARNTLGEALIQLDEMVIDMFFTTCKAATPSVRNHIVAEIGENIHLIVHDAVCMSLTIALYRHKR